MFDPITISISALLITLIYASILDIRDRRVPFHVWYPAIIVCTPLALIKYLQDPQSVIIPMIFSIVFYFSAYIKMFGGADAWALIFITLFASPTPFFPGIVLFYATVIAIIFPFAVYARDYYNGQRNPFLKTVMGYGIPFIVPVTMSFVISVALTGLAA